MKVNTSFNATTKANSHKSIFSFLCMENHSSSWYSVKESRFQHSPLCHFGHLAHLGTKTWRICDQIIQTLNNINSFRNDDISYWRKMKIHMFAYPLFSGVLSTHFMFPSFSISDKPIHTRSLTNEDMYLCECIKTEKCHSQLLLNSLSHTHAHKLYLFFFTVDDDQISTTILTELSAVWPSLRLIGY